MDEDQTPLSLAQEAARASLAASAVAQHVADIALAQHADVVGRLDELKVELGGQRISLVETRADLRRIEALGVTTAAQAALTNGSVTALRLWQAEMKGISQGAGGTGRFVVYVLGAGASAGGIVAAVIMILNRLGGGQ